MPQHRSVLWDGNVPGTVHQRFVLCRPIHWYHPILCVGPTARPVLHRSLLWAISMVQLAPALCSTMVSPAPWDRPALPYLPAPVRQGFTGGDQECLKNLTSVFGRDADAIRVANSNGPHVATTKEYE
jgi:hypothetical protein